MLLNIEDNYQFQILQKLRVCDGNEIVVKEE